jgi:hypothetical protein
MTGIANKSLANHWSPPPHHLQHLADTKPVAEPTPASSSQSQPVMSTSTRLHNSQTRKRPLAKVDVFVDDFIGLVQGSPSKLSKIRCTLLHTLDQVLHPLDKFDGPHCKEPASTKKLKQGDPYRATWKLILGWIIDTVVMTLELPIHHQERLQTILSEVPMTQKRISVKKWQQILGEFRSMAIAIAIPGSCGLFSLLQEALPHQSEGRIGLSCTIHDTLDDFRWLATDLASRPTCMHESVPQPNPDLVGAQGVVRSGMGGVWFPASTSLQARTAHNGWWHCRIIYQAGDPFCGGHGSMTTPLASLYRSKPPLELSPIRTWSWRPPSCNTMLRRSNSMLASAPSSVGPTTLPLSSGSAKAPLLPREPPPTCCVSSCCINASIATTLRRRSSFPAKSMAWRVIVHECGISLTRNFSPILNCITCRPPPGA